MANGVQQEAAVAVPWAPPEPSRAPGTRFALTIGVLAGVVLATFAGALAWEAWKDRPPHEPRRAVIDYGQFISLARADGVRQIYYDNPTGVITGTFANGHTEKGVSHFKAKGPRGSLPVSDVILLVDHHVVIGSESGGPQPPTRSYDPWWGRAFEWLSILQAALFLLGIVAAVGFVWIRHRAA